MWPIVVSREDEERPLQSFPLPLQLEQLLPGTGAWEVELGFGKGRYLLAAAEREPGRRFLGIEMAAKYYRLARNRARRRRLRNVALIRGEALYLLAAALPTGFATGVHVYFPDPWPKSRHQKRRLFDPESLDLVIGLLRPGGRLFFATDFTDYGEEVAAMLHSHPAMRTNRRETPWPDGPRTNYEAKYVREDRSILRLEAELRPDGALELVHPAGRTAIVCALPAAGVDEGEDDGVRTVEQRSG
jgi:tRNA (guanine-N7-)-methyltransferase